MSMDHTRIEILTDASGDASEVTGHLKGKLHGIAVKLGTAVAVGVTIDNADGINLFTDAGLTNGFSLARLKTVSELGTDITYDGTRKVFDTMPVSGELTITIANGGDAKTAAIVLYLDQ